MKQREKKLYLKCFLGISLVTISLEVALFILYGNLVLLVCGGIFFISLQAYLSEPTEPSVPLKEVLCFSIAMGSSVWISLIFAYQESLFAIPSLMAGIMTFVFMYKHNIGQWER